MDSDWIDNSYFSDEQRRAAEDYLAEVGADISLDRRMSAGRQDDFRLFVNNDKHDLSGYLGRTEDGDIAVIVPDAPASITQAHMLPGDQVVLQGSGDQFIGRLRNTFHGRRDEDPGNAFVLTIHPA